MNNTHRYPLRAANGEQLLQKRTKPAAQSVTDKDKRVLTDQFTGPNQENSSSFANKKVRRDLSHHGQQPMGQQHPAGFKQAPGTFKAHEMKLKKTNPRMGSMKGGVLSGDHYPGMNQRKGKQLKKVEGKDHQQQFMQYPMMPQYPMQYPQMPPQMMPMGMQFPVQQMGPHGVGYHPQNPQIAEMQKQINFLSQMTYMQSNQMAQMHQQMSHETMFAQPEFSQMQGSQFQGSYYPKGEQVYGNMYGTGYHQGMQPETSDIYPDQEEYYEEDNEFEQHNLSQHSQEDVNELHDEPLEQDLKKVKGSKRIPISRGKSNSKLASPSKLESADQEAGIKPGEDTLNCKKNNQTDEDLKDYAKLAPNSKMRDHSDYKSKNVKSQSPREVAVPITRHSKKAKLQEIHDNRNIIDDGTNVRRTTRSMLNKAPTRRRIAQGKGKDSPKKPQTTPTKIKVIPQSQSKQVSNSRSPKGTPSKDRTPRKQRQPIVNMSASQDESSVQITHRETRYSSRLSSAKQSSNATGMLDQKQKELQSLKEEIEVEESTHRELLNKQQNSTKQNKRKNTDIVPEFIIEGRRTRGKAARRSPSKDENLLFGNDAGHSQKSVAETNLNQESENKTKGSKKQGNSLLKKQRKEAQTQIIDRKLDEDMQDHGNGSKSVYQNESAEEDEKEDEVEKEYARLQKEKERIQNEIATKIFDDQQLKDMSLLFGMSEDEINAIKKQQDEQLQMLKDQLLLFGDQQMSSKINEFLTPNSVNVKKELIKTESQVSDVRLTKVVSDNRVIDVDQAKEVKTEQEEILIFNENSTTQEQQRIIKDENVGQIYQQNTDTQDINIVLEVQKPIESESQDLKLEKSLVLQNDPSSNNGGVLQINHQSFDNSKLVADNNQEIAHDLPRFNEEDEQMLFNEHPINNINVLDEDNNKSNDLIQTSSQQMHRQNQIQQNFEKNEMPSHDVMLAHNVMGNQEQDDTFKIDNKNNDEVGLENDQTEELPDNHNDTEDERIDGEQPVKVLSNQEKSSAQHDSILIQKENLMKQIEQLQQQIEEDKKKLDQQHQIFNSNKEQTQRLEEEQNENENLRVNEVGLDQEDDDDQTMQDQDEKEFEVNLEHDNVESQNDLEDNNIQQIEMVEPEKDITDLVDHLPLPDNYELLITFVSAIDQGINMLQSRQMKTNFTNLRKIIANQTKRNFTIDYLKQIFYIQPTFYLHNWEFKQEKYDLIIQIPRNIQELLLADDHKEYVPSNQGIQLPLSQTLMRARASHIRKLLLKRVYSNYQQFMQNHSHRLGNSSKSTPQQHHQLSSLQADHDIFATRRWPGLFDLNNPRLVPEVPTSGEGGTPLLKEQPMGGRGRETVQDFVHRNDTKEKIREAVEEANRQQMISGKLAGSNNQGDDMSDDESNQLSDSSDEARRMSMKQNIKTGVDENTLAVVRMKEQMDLQAKEKAIEEQKRNEVQKNIESHIKCSEQIKQLFQFAQGSTIRYNEVRQKLLNAQQSSGTFISSDQLNSQIQNLTKILPEWIKLVESNHAYYVRLSKNIGIQQFDISNRIKQYFMNEKSKQIENLTQENQSQLQHAQKRDRLDSEQARLKQQVMEKQNEPLRQTKSCPPVTGQKQQSNYTGFGQQQSGQERSLNQSALSQKSNSLSNHQQEMQSPSLAEQVVNLSNQQHQMQKKNNQSAFQPFQKVLQSQSVQSQSETPINQVRKTSTEFNGCLDSEMATEQHHSGANQGNQNPQYFGSGSRLPNTSSNQQQHMVQPSSNSVFKQVTPHSQKGQSQNKSNSGYSNDQYHELINDQGETGDLNLMNFSKNQQHHDQGEQGHSGQRSGTHSANRHFINKPSSSTYNNLKQNSGLDNLLKTVMLTNGEHGMPKNYSPVKKDTSQQRTSHNGGQQQPSNHHQNIYESNSISASMGPMQFGNDIYQGLHSSSRGRGQSGSPYGAAPSHTTAQQQSLLAINDDIIENANNVVTGNQISGTNLPNYRPQNNEFQQNNFSGHHQVSQQHHPRNRMNSGDREQNYGSGRFHNGHHGQHHSYF